MDSSAAQPSDDPARLGKEDFTRILRCLDPPSLAAAMLVNRTWCKFARCPDLWEAYCQELWADKEYVAPHIRQHQDRHFAYGASLSDAQRTTITMEELCRWAWDASFKDSNQSLWMILTGGSALRRYFHEDGTVTAAVDDPLVVNGLHESKSVWRFYTSWKGEPGCFIKHLRRHPPMKVQRSVTWGWIMDCEVCMYVAAVDVPRPAKGAEPPHFHHLPVCPRLVVHAPAQATVQPTAHMTNPAPSSPPLQQRQQHHQQSLAGLTSQRQASVPTSADSHTSADGPVRPAAAGNSMSDGIFSSGPEAQPPPLPLHTAQRHTGGRERGRYGGSSHRGGSLLPTAAGAGPVGMATLGAAAASAAPSGFATPFTMLQSFGGPTPGTMHQFVQYTDGAYHAPYPIVPRVLGQAGAAMGGMAPVSYMCPPAPPGGAAAGAAAAAWGAGGGLGYSYGMWWPHSPGGHTAAGPSWMPQQHHQQQQQDGFAGSAADCPRDEPADGPTKGPHMAPDLPEWGDEGDGSEALLATLQLVQHLGGGQEAGKQLMGSWRVAPLEQLRGAYMRLKAALAAFGPGELVVDVFKEDFGVTGM